MKSRGVWAQNLKSQHKSTLVHSIKIMGGCGERERLRESDCFVAG
jgi:hypothetical protein